MQCQLNDRVRTLTLLRGGIEGSKVAGMSKFFVLFFGFQLEKCICRASARIESVGRRRYPGAALANYSILYQSIVWLHGDEKGIYLA